MDESGESRHIGRVEDNHNVVDIRAVLLDVVTELSGDLAVALEKILAGHTVLAWSAAGRDDELGACESLLRIGCPSHVGTWKSAVVHFLGHTVDSRFDDVIETDVRSKTEHKSGLSHVGADRTACTDDEQLLVCQKSHC